MGEKSVPYFFTGDEAIPLGENLTKGYLGRHPKGSKVRIFNYRIFRAHRVVENEFGLLSSVVQVLRKPKLLEPEKAQLTVMTIVYLHSFLQRCPDSSAVYILPGMFDYEENSQVIEGSWRAMINENMTALFPIKNDVFKPTLKAKEIREELAAYFLSGRTVEWQNDYTYGWHIL
jgi:hypothetical protein